MGVLYSVFPIDDEIAAYLRDEGVSFTPGTAVSRNPTPLEVRAVCDRLDGFQPEYTAGAGKSVFQVLVSGATDPEREAWTLLNVSDFDGREGVPHKIWFEKGWPSLIIRILHGLAVACGQLLLVPDTGESPLVISSDVALDELYARWERTRERWEAPDPSGE